MGRARMSDSLNAVTDSLLKLNTELLSYGHNKNRKIKIDTMD